MAERKASTVWTGDLASGTGKTTLDSSGAAQLSVSWPSRTEDPQGLTSPEELIGAAHSSCFSMQLSGLLTEAGHPPERLDTSAEVTLGKSGAGFAITGIELSVRADVPGIEESAFQETAEKAKQICPVSAALAGTTITLDATLK